jgi:hypothetical protein
MDAQWKTEFTDLSQRIKNKLVPLRVLVDVVLEKSGEDADVETLSESGLRSISEILGMLDRLEFSLRGNMVE